jgi:rubrerythrin
MGDEAKSEERRGKLQNEKPFDGTGGAIQGRRMLICDRCGVEMHENNCKIICPNCGSRFDCSDLSIYFD